MKKSLFYCGDRRKYILVIVTLIIGTVLTNLAGPSHVMRWDIFTKEFADSYTRVKIGFGQLFGHILWNRLKIYGVLLVISLTRFKNAGAYCLCAYLGLAMGVCMSAVAMHYGGRYLLVALTAFLLHMLMYCGSICLLYQDGKLMGERRYTAYIFSVLLLIGGIILETLMNIIVLPAIL